MKVRRSLPSIARNQGGAAAVEFAIVSTVFCTFILGIAYLGIMLYTYIGVHWALEKGARVAVINTSTTQTDVATAINNYLNGMGVASATVTYTQSTTPITRAHITASLTQSYTIPFLKTFNITVSAETYVPQSS